MVVCYSSTWGIPPSTTMDPYRPTVEVNSLANWIRWQFVLVKKQLVLDWRGSQVCDHQSSELTRYLCAQQDLLISVMELAVTWSSLPVSWLLLRVSHKTPSTHGSSVEKERERENNNLFSWKVWWKKKSSYELLVGVDPLTPGSRSLQLSSSVLAATLLVDISVLSNIIYLLCYCSIQWVDFYWEDPAGGKVDVVLLYWDSFSVHLLANWIRWWEETSCQGCDHGKKQLRGTLLARIEPMFAGAKCRL